MQGSNLGANYALTRTGDTIDESGTPVAVASIANVHTATNDVYVEGAFEDGRSFLVGGFRGINIQRETVSTFLAEGDMVSVGHGVVRTFSRVRRLPIGGPFAGLLRNANGPFFGDYVTVENGTSVWVTGAARSGGGGGGGCAVSPGTGSSSLLLLGVVAALTMRRRRRAGAP